MTNNSKTTRSTLSNFNQPITPKKWKWVVRKNALATILKTQQEPVKLFRKRTLIRKGKKTRKQLVNFYLLNTRTWVLTILQETLHWTINLFARRTVKMSNLDKYSTDKTNQATKLKPSQTNRLRYLIRNLPRRWINPQIVIQHQCIGRYLQSLIKTQRIRAFSSVNI